MVLIIRVEHAKNRFIKSPAVMRSPDSVWIVSVLMESVGARCWSYRGLGLLPLAERRSPLNPVSKNAYEKRQ